MIKDYPCWQLFRDVSKRGKVRYYLQEFFSGKQKKLSPKLSKQAETLYHKKIRADAQAAKYELQMQNIIEVALTR